MAYINAISYYLPGEVLTNETLHSMFPDWSVDKIAAKTGIQRRYIASEEESSSTMAIEAARLLFETHAVSPADIDFILLCTQSPDYVLPTTACMVQSTLHIPTTAGALDFNLGCSGYVYGLGLAKGLLLTNDVKNVLLITSETYSKYLGADDKSVRTIFGDAASATLISSKPSALAARIGHLSYGTDGTGAQHLIVKKQSALFMNGPEIFSFTLKRVPEMIQETLDRNNARLEEVDLFIFHQANKYMLDHLMKKLNIPVSKFFIHMENCGNTVSSTIPIAMEEARKAGHLKQGMKVMLAGFGVGLSWSGTILQL